MPPKAKEPMETNDAGSNTVVSFVQHSNAYSSIDVVPSATTITPSSVPQSPRGERQGLKQGLSWLAGISGGAGGGIGGIGGMTRGPPASRRDSAGGESEQGHGGSSAEPRGLSARPARRTHSRRSPFRARTRWWRGESARRRIKLAATARILSLTA